jgi:hypothetical protein
MKVSLIHTPNDNTKTNKIESIKKIRKITGMDLYASKRVLDTLMEDIAAQVFVEIPDGEFNRFYIEMREEGFLVKQVIAKEEEKVDSTLAEMTITLVKKALDEGGIDFAHQILGIYLDTF